MKKIHLFPWYQTREQYVELTGKQPPPYNPNLPIKCWEDLDVKNKTATYQFYYVLAIKDNQPRLDSNGKMYFELYPVRTEHAKVVNIPPKGFDVPQDHSAVMWEVPMPCRDLKEGEKLVMNLFGGPTVVSPEDIVLNDKGEDVNDLSKLGERVQRLEDKNDAVLELLKELTKEIKAWSTPVNNVG